MPTQAVRIITNGVSEGARALGETLESMGVRVSRVRVGAPKLPSRLNIKWGCFTFDPRDYGGSFINGSAGPDTLNKYRCFRGLAGAGVPIPDYTDDMAIVREWFSNGARRVYERHILTGSEGDGIRVIEGVDDLNEAPLYTKGMFGLRREYRIHVFQQAGVKRIFIQQKKRRTTDVAETTSESRIRNLANGWIFAHNDIVAPRKQTIDCAVAAIQTFNMQFGAVDLIEMDDVTLGSAVLEINAAPGLQGGTLQFYAEAIHDVIHGVVDEAPEEAVEVVLSGPEDDDDLPIDADDYDEEQY